MSLREKRRGGEKYMDDQNMKNPNKKSAETMAHLYAHIQYPASKQDIISVCNNMSDVSEEDKNWVKENLPDKIYQNVDEVKTALNLE